MFRANPPEFVFAAATIASLTVCLVAIDASAHRSGKKYKGPRLRFHLSADSGGTEDADPEPETEKETPSLVGQGPGGIGGFGGVTIGYAPIAGDAGLVIGGEGALMLGHRFSIGGAGFGLVNDISRDSVSGDRSRIGLGFGGILVRYHLVHDYPVYPTLGALIGFGGLSFDDNGGDAVMIIEPNVAIYMNITHWIRLGVSISYRFLNGVDTPGLANADLRGPTVSGHINLGFL